MTGVIYLRDPDAESIREAVVQLLTNVKSIAALARTLEVSRGKLYKWRDGRSTPTIYELCGMATALGQHVRIDMGEVDEGRDAEVEDVAVLVGRILANQERMFRVLRELGPATE